MVFGSRNILNPLDRLETKSIPHESEYKGILRGRDNSVVTDRRRTWGGRFITAKDASFHSAMSDAY